MVIQKLGVLCMLVLLNGTNIASAPSASFELQSILAATDCINISSRRAFSLNVLGLSFPVSKGYGFDHGAAAFRTHPELHPADKLDQYPDRAAADAALKQYAASSASIKYYPTQGDEPTSIERLEGFQSIEWRGVMLHYRVMVGGKVSKESLIYQLTLGAEGYNEELTITAGGPELIADIVACAEET